MLPEVNFVAGLLGLGVSAKRQRRAMKREGKGIRFMVKFGTAFSFSLFAYHAMAEGFHPMFFV
jgi:hypothetical protein